MDPAQRGSPGPIGKLIALVQVLNEPTHHAALAADLIRLGLRLRWLHDPDDDRLRLTDLYALLPALTSDTRSALYRAMRPDEWQWTQETMLLAGILDQLAVISWQTAGDPRAPRPEPIPRPGVGPRHVPVMVTEGGFNPSRAVDPRDWLGWEKTPA